MTFIDELLLESEQKEKEQKIVMNRLRADQLLMALSVLEARVADLNTLVDDEVKILEDYREIELHKLNKKMSWLEWNLEQFIRSTGEKTINLAHGNIKLRMGRDKVEIVDMEKFIPIATANGLLKKIPESTVPDLELVKLYIKNARRIPAGVTLQPAQTKFSYNTLKGKRNGELTEIGIEAEGISTAETAEG